MQVGDLHCHTRLSDGSLPPEDLVRLGQRLKLDVIAITDHDTLAGCRQAKDLEKGRQIRVIPGAEFSCVDEKRGRKVHLLCYGPKKLQVLEPICQEIGRRRREAVHQMIEKVAAHYPITQEMVERYAKDSTCVYKTHIMEALMDLGYDVEVYGVLFRQLFHQKTGAYLVTPRFPSAFEMLSLIHEAGGTAVLAHPEIYDSLEVLEELIEEGLDGVEVWHPRNSPATRQHLLERAKEHRLLTTGGSDFHGRFRGEAVPLGTCTTPEQSLRQLLDRVER
ncbi:error-prone DNA polymerase [Eubacteriaceae bacterium CHKCI005]|nr:error-prone DNA polymerase [Eubacteriaceae bacterium CHKCI005]